MTRWNDDGDGMIGREYVMIKELVTEIPNMHHKSLS